MGCGSICKNYGVSSLKRLRITEVGKMFSLCSGTMYVKKYEDKYIHKNRQKTKFILINYKIDQHNWTAWHAVTNPKEDRTELNFLTSPPPSPQNKGNVSFPKLSQHDWILQPVPFYLYFFSKVYSIIGKMSRLIQSNRWHGRWQHSSSIQIGIRNWRHMLWEKMV